MKTGFIGFGNMASAMAGGMLKTRRLKPEEIMVSDKSEAALQRARTEFGVAATSDNCEVVRFADLLILAVKPNYLEGVLLEIAPGMDEKKLVVSLAPGKTIPWMEETFDRKVKLIRTMPNTPALVGEGMTALCPNALVKEDELKKVEELFHAFCKTAVISENLMDVATGVSGSSPAYVFMFIEALADAAVHEGMPRAQAYQFAAQGVLGSAKMVLETGRHPGELKDMVCSPGGTTIEAVRVLEEMGFRSAVMEAVLACVEKSRDM